MKAWMDRIIVSRPRRGTGCDHCAARAGRLLRRNGRAAGRTAYEQQDGDGVYVRVKHRPLRHRKWTQHRDHLAPIERALEARLGEEWNAIWADVCAVADRRSLRGWHLRAHAELLVEQDPLRVESAYGFYVEAGILTFRHREQSLPR
jgi:hypothetical protein